MKKDKTYTLNIPFYFGTTINNNNDGKPKRLKFDYYYDDSLDLLRQRPYKTLKELLNSIYLEGNLADGSVGDDYSNAYLGFILNKLIELIEPSHKVLEIGYGNGIILKGLSEKFDKKNLFGLEPGNHNLVEGLDAVCLMNDFFPSKKIDNQFDFIYSICVLEHIENPIEFLKGIIKNLKNDGTCLIGVPNCEENLKAGDISVFFHEHFSYFTRNSFVAISKLLGINSKQIYSYKGMLFWIFTKMNSHKTISLPNSIHSKFNFEKYNRLKSRIAQLLKDYTPSRTLIYAPSRAINILSEIEVNDVILVDDNKNIHGRYLPFFEKQIQSLESINVTQVDLILIFSITFSDVLFKKCENKFGHQKVNIVTIKELI